MATCFRPGLKVLWFGRANDFVDNVGYDGSARTSVVTPEMKKNLIQFLFADSQVDDEIAALVEDIADMDVENSTTLKVDKAPLSKIISALGIEGGSLEADPRGLSMSFDDGDLFRAAHALLNEPDSMHKLAGAGWVYSLQGDVAQSNEPADFRIRFLEIDEIEPENLKVDPDSGIDARNKRVTAIMKAGREFATTKPGHDEHSTLDYDGKGSDDRGKGVGKEKDGAQPEGKPKGATKESREIVVEGKSRKLKCDSCEALSVNGVATHERGCPNSRKPWVASDDDERMVPGERSDDDEQDESLAEAGRYNKRNWPLCKCDVCGARNHVEPHGTTADCKKCGKSTEHTPLDFDYFGKVRKPTQEGGHKSPGERLPPPPTEDYESDQV
jgi:hypothetical protein